jgi:hypothetical protein
MLIDTHGRAATDLRVSLTGRCNLRCPSVLMPGLNEDEAPDLLSWAVRLHRGDAFEACRELIDDLKHEVPIGKHQKFPDGTDEWSARSAVVEEWWSGDGWVGRRVAPSSAPAGSTSQRSGSISQLASIRRASSEREPGSAW